MHRSNYFSAALQHPDVYEIHENRLEILNYNSDVVEIMLRYIYNDAICLSDFFNIRNIIDVMKIAKEYYFTDLFNTCDQGYIYQVGYYGLFTMACKNTGCLGNLPYKMPISH